MAKDRKHESSSALQSDKIVDAARRHLERSPHLRGSSQIIQIECHDGTLVLNGRLPSFYMKQILQTTLANVDGVERIDNRVDVYWPSD